MATRPEFKILLIKKNHPEITAREKTTNKQAPGANKGGNAMRSHHRDTSFSMPASHNTGYDTERTVLPLPPAMGEESRFEMEIYARFMRHLRQVPNNRMDIKVLSSIQFTADMLDTSDALVAKTLVDLGLRAPRAALPVAFLDFTDNSFRRAVWDAGTDLPQASLVALKRHWDRIGEEGISSSSCGWKRYSVFDGESTWVAM